MYNPLDFLKKDKPLQKFVYAAGKVDGHLKIKDQFHTDESSEEEDEPITLDTGTDYAKEYVEREDKEFLQKYLTAQAESVEKPMSRLDTITPMPGTSHEPIEAANQLEELFSRFNFVQEKKPELAINFLEQRICEMISSEQIYIIQGPTGCGKSTQVPQFLLNMCKKKGQYCKIAVTQPRRIAAITVAKRVSEERGWPLGTVVGYKVGLEAQAGEDTVLTYMTTGVLLQQIVNSKNLNMYTHIILDEVHERDQEMDFLLLVVKKFSRDPSCRTKIVLMSATIDSQKFADYFKRPSFNPDPRTDQNPFQEVGILDVVKPSGYDVHIFYLDQLKQILDCASQENLKFDIDSAKINDGLFNLVEILLTAFDRTDGDCEKPGSVLIFLPGIFEIQVLHEKLTESHSKRAGESGIAKNWILVPLHSSITVEEQKKAFEPAQPNQRKIILSTNIAESSITVSDVVYVIDFCLTKILVCDPQTNYSHLKLSWASRSNCIQRAGRVGRVGAGRVYRLVEQRFYENELPERTEPEILRCPLHRLVLLAKMLNMGPPHGILALAMDTPNLTNIRQTVDTLKEAGALLLTTTKVNEIDKREVQVYDEKDGDLTYVGRIMAKLPLDINSSRLIIFGHIFGVLHDATIMAAAMSLQNIFSSPFNERMKAYMSKLNWASGSFSDLIAYVHVYTVWEQNKYSNSMRSRGAEKQWMQRYYLQPKVMREWNILVNDLKLRLNRIGITEMVNNPITGTVTQQEKAMMLKVVICGAFYPNYFVRSSEGGQVDEAVAVRTLGGRDPYTTVYFTGKPPDQPGQLYVSKIKEVLSDCSIDVHVSFDKGGSGKVYVQFRKGSSRDVKLPGKIATEVFRAVKHRQLRMQTEIRCISAEEGNRRLAIWRDQQNSRSNAQKQNWTFLPGPEISFLELNVISVHSPSLFYAQNKTDPDVKRIEQEIINALNKPQLDPVLAIKIGELYAAPFEKMYYRARVTYVYSCGPDQFPDVDVLFIDYGNRERINRSQLRIIQSEIKEHPPLVMECALAHVRPSLTVDGRPEWTEESIKIFCKLTINKNIFAKVYSVVDGVCAVELYPQGRNSSQHSINNILVNKGYAIQSHESFLSEDDHNMRIQIQESHRNDISTTEILREADPWTRDNEQNVPAPLDRECKQKMVLRGPFSPLEMSIFSIVHCSESNKVTIESSSVNSVLLDTDPQEEYDRLLVAGAISTSADKTRLVLRHTTLMPSLRGLPVLMGLIFAPRAVIHTNKAATRIISVLCGLGYDPENFKPRLQQHDIVFNLDFELSNEDIKVINEIREYMNLTIEAVKCFLNEETAVFPMESCQTEILYRLKLLLKTHREPLERIHNQAGLSWCHAATEIERITDDREIWPPHSLVTLAERSEAQNAEISKHVEKLNDMALNMIPMTEITCQLCNIKIYEVHDMRLHLMSQQHTENMKKLNITDTNQ